MDAADAAGSEKANTGHVSAKHCASDGCRSPPSACQGDGQVASANLLNVLRCAQMSNFGWRQANFDLTIVYADGGGDRSFCANSLFHCLSYFNIDRIRQAVRDNG